MLPLLTQHYTWSQQWGGEDKFYIKHQYSETSNIKIINRKSCKCYYNNVIFIFIWSALLHILSDISTFRFIQESTAYCCPAKCCVTCKETAEKVHSASFDKGCSES